MDELTIQAMKANGANSSLAFQLWNALAVEREAHQVTREELEGLKLRLDDKERDL